MRAEIGSGAATSRGCLEPPELRKGGRILPKSLHRGHGPADTLTPDFQPPEL